MLRIFGLYMNVFFVQCQKKVVVLLTEPTEKEDTLLVSIVRNGEAVEVPGVSKRNPYTLAFRVPDVYLGLTALVGVRVTKNGRELGCKQLKCESQLHALEQVLRVCDQPLDFTCQVRGGWRSLIIDWSSFSCLEKYWFDPTHH